MRREDFSSVVWALLGIILMASWSLRYHVVTAGDSLYLVNNITGTVSFCNKRGCIELEYVDVRIQLEGFTE